MKKFILGCFSLIFAMVVLIGGFIYYQVQQNEKEHEAFNNKLYEVKKGYSQDLYQGQDLSSVSSELPWTKVFLEELNLEGSSLASSLEEMHRGDVLTTLEDEQMRQKISSSFPEGYLAKVLAWDLLERALSTGEDGKFAWKLPMDSTHFVDWSNLALLDILEAIDQQKWEEANHKITLYWQMLSRVDYFSHVEDPSIKVDLVSNPFNQYFRAASRSRVVERALERNNQLLEHSWLALKSVENQWDKSIALMMNDVMHLSYQVFSSFSMQMEEEGLEGSYTMELLARLLAKSMRPSITALQDIFDSYHRADITKEELIAQLEELNSIEGEEGRSFFDEILFKGIKFREYITLEPLTEEDNQMLEGNAEIHAERSTEVEGEAEVILFPEIPDGGEVD